MWHKYTTYRRHSPLPTVFLFSWSSSEERSSVCIAIDTANAPAPLFVPSRFKKTESEGEVEIKDVTYAPNTACLRVSWVLLCTTRISSRSIQSSFCDQTSQHYVLRIYPSLSCILCPAQTTGLVLSHNLPKANRPRLASKLKAKQE